MFYTCRAHTFQWKRGEMYAFNFLSRNNGLHLQNNKRGKVLDDIEMRIFLLHKKAMRTGTVNYKINGGQIC